MNRPPRSLGDSLFGKRSLFVGLVQGLGQLAVEILFIFWALPIYGEQVVRAAVFTCLVLCNLGLILLGRAGKRPLFETIGIRNRPQVWVTVGAIGLLGLSLYVPWVQRLFLFASVPSVVLCLSVIAAFASIGISNVARRWNIA